MQFFTKLFQKITTDNIPTFSAALSYYFLLSLAPLFLLTIIFLRVFLDKEYIQALLRNDIILIIGTDASNFLSGAIENLAENRGENMPSRLVGILILLFGSLSGINQLKSALNRIWAVEVNTSISVGKKLQLFLKSVSMVFLFSFIILGLVVLNVILSYFSAILEIQLPTFMVSIIQQVINIFILTNVIAIIYNYLPDAKIHLKDSYIGAFFTSVLILVGVNILNMYLNRIFNSTLYGTSGTVILFIVWIHYTSFMFLVGAELTRLWSEQYGSKIQGADLGQKS